MSDDRLIVALDVPNIVTGLDLANRLGSSVSFYKNWAWHVNRRRSCPCQRA